MTGFLSKLIKCHLELGLEVGLELAAHQQAAVVQVNKSSHRRAGFDRDVRDPGKGLPGNAPVTGIY